ncbi:hypothetical protein E1I69_02315 [Bacillus timonensis]|uniref:Uncharacterized protein n=1 Tax=Bacillus timonensis TaxID=1033734 RepID=A0A4S3PZ06_9BACI|nr:hypothetical protein [Bacillus timonensis]THE15169.1 hypothetical protein E1I69_02315 [Bacillus timonensis]
MFRYNYNGKELIIRFVSQTKNINLNKDDLYNKIISIRDKILDADQGTSFIVEDDQGRLAVGTVQQGELTVISIHHLVEQTQVYLQRREAKKPS